MITSSWKRINGELTVKRDKVYCCRLDTEELWQFESEPITFVQEVIVDNDNNNLVQSGLKLLVSD